MRKLTAVITLVRLPNLVFIFLTQLLTHYFIIVPSLTENDFTTTLSNADFLLLCLSTVLIAAAGYIINDYFDIGIDAINKPHKVTIEKIFKRRTIIIWHITLNVIALLIAGYIAFHFLQLRLVIIQVVSILLLVFYSTTFKRKLIIGNFTIALLTSLTLLTVALFEPKFQLFDRHFMHAKLFWMYVSFSFIITFIREIVKDVEDVKGDTAQHCQTIPLVWGIAAAKQITYFFILLLIALLIVADIYFFSFNKMLVVFLTTTVMLPVIFIAVRIYQATNSTDFHTISTYVKIVTLFGILSILLI